MIQIGDVVVSLDVFQEKFLCDLGACKGRGPVALKAMPVLR